MAGEHLEEAQLGWHGVTGDRRWAFVRGDTPRSGFPWLTIREEPPLAQYRPYLRDRARPDRSETWVRTPDGDELDVIDPALAAGLAPGSGSMHATCDSLINVDPASLERDPAVLKTIGRERDTCLGVYGSTVQPGVIRVGDTVAIGG